MTIPTPRTLAGGALHNGFSQDSTTIRRQALTDCDLHLQQTVRWEFTSDNSTPKEGTGQCVLGAVHLPSERVLSDEYYPNAHILTFHVLQHSGCQRADILTRPLETITVSACNPIMDAVPVVLSARTRGVGRVSMVT
jgi:hypothetical protein